MGRITNSLSQRLAVPAWAQSASVIARVNELTIPWKAGRIQRVARHEDVACSVVYKPPNKHPETLTRSLGNPTSISA